MVISSLTKIIILCVLLTVNFFVFFYSRPQVECKKGYVVIPRTKLYYLAPEILRVLMPCPEVPEAGGDLYPYSERTDVFAFR